MLTDLHIKDVVIIENLALDFRPGFASLTGETGAGKSIILDALGLSLGQRSEARLVRQGSEQASVTATFDLSDNKIISHIKELFDESDLSLELPLILRRTLTRDGRSKAFINDQPVSIGFLKNLGEELVEIHGQFETQKLLDPKTHRHILDAFGGLDKNLLEVSDAWGAWQKAAKALKELEKLLEQAQRDQEYWIDAAKELRDLNPVAEEEEKLVTERSVMMHAEKILKNMDDAEQALTANTGARQRMHTALKNLERVQDKIPDQLIPIIDVLNRALNDIDEAVDGLERIAHDMQFDHQSQSVVDERLFALRAAARKYGVAVTALPDLLQEIEEKRALVQDQSAQRNKLQKQVGEARVAYIEKAQALSQKRQAAGVKLSKAVMAELTPLKLEKAKFTVSVEAKAEDSWSADGIDQALFLISTNPGMEPGPLNKIASGGEMARFMLALKVVTQEAENTPTLIFDEVDTGVGGAVAEAVGLRLRRLGDSAQVLAITHSPQVAAKGHHHLRISKQVTNKTTRTAVELLTVGERTEEIARMLSGSVVTTEARGAALNLLDIAPVAKKARTKTA
ncbi:MAG: recN [Alphaproteobacteria bacterium]|nr:recN [Alphaproteobacteria bacterium]